MQITTRHGVPSPGPRCAFTDDPLLRRPEARGEVRVLTDDTVVVIRNPTDWLSERFVEGCGTYLDAMEENAEDLEDWWMRSGAQPGQVQLSGGQPGSPARFGRHARRW